MVTFIAGEVEGLCSHLFFVFVDIESVFRFDHCFSFEIFQCRVWVWTDWVVELTDREFHFRMGIIPGTIPSWFLVLLDAPGTVSESIRIFEFEKTSSNLDTVPQIRKSVLFEFPGQFYKDSAFNLLRNLCHMNHVNSRNGRVPWLPVPRTFLLYFWRNGCQLSLFSQPCHLSQGRNVQQ